MSIYFEINDAVRDMYPDRYPGKYCVTQGSIEHKNYETLLLSNRAWSTDGNNVKFIKNRMLGPDAEVDEKEFFWIALKSHVI